MKPSIVLTKKFFTVITLLFFSTHSVFAALAVNNGNFSDLTGLTNAGGGWYHGTPNSWTAPGDGGAFSNQYVINTATLNLDHTGTVSQSIGTVDLGGEDITVTFEYGDIWNGGYYADGEAMMTAELWDTTTNTLLATKTVTNNTALYGTLVSDSLSTTSPATVGNTLEVRFTSLPGTGTTPGMAVALDNIAVIATDSTAPTITNISSDTIDGSYNENDIIDIDVTFSEAVTSPNVTVTLNTGGTCNFPVTNATTGTCNYTVGAGENSSDLTVSSVSGIIQDATLNTLTNFVPTTNLATNKAIIIDTTAPSVPTNILPNGTFVNTDSWDFTWDVSTDNEVGAITYEYQASQDPTVDGFGVLTNGVWSSGTLGTNLINSTGASQGVWYWQVRSRDLAGNYSAWSPVASVTKDTIAPVISADGSFLTVGPVTATGAVITYSTVPTAIDVGTPSPTVTCLPASGTNFPLNSTATITCNSTDNAGNTGVQLFNIFIQDVEDPTLLLPGDIYVESVAPASTTATFTVSATDNVDTFGAPVTSGSAPAIVCSHLTGDTFNFGTTLVTCTVTDSGGNDTTDDFNVIVEDTIDPTLIITLDDTALNVGDTALVTFTFSEAPVGFDNADVTIENGTIDTIAGSGTVYTATLTPTAGIEDTTNTITVGTDWSDGNIPTGNAPAGSTDSPNYEIDTLAPTPFNIARPSDNEVIEEATTDSEGSCETGATITIAGSALQTNPTTTTCVGGQFLTSITFISASLDTTFNLTFTQTDTAGNTNIKTINNIQYKTKVVTGGGSGPANTDFVTTTSTPPTETTPTPTPTQPTNPTTPTETAPTSEPTPVTPTETTTENPSTPTDNTSTPEPTPEPTPTPTSSTSTGGGTTGNTTGNSTGTGNTGSAGGQGFDPADATLDQGGGGTSEETEEAVTEAPTFEATTDIGGGNAVEETTSYTLLWTLLGLIALLNTWWFFVAKSGPTIHRRD